MSQKWRTTASIVALFLVFVATLPAAETQATRCTNATQIDLCFLIDRSGSICNNDPSFNSSLPARCDNWAFVVNYVYEFVSRIFIGPSDTRVAVITFQDNAELNWNLSQYLDKGSLLTAINTSLKYMTNKSANLTLGLNLMADEVFNVVDRPKALKRAIIITDGDKPGIENSDAALARVHGLNITTFVVGFGYISDAAETFKYLSSPPHLENVTYFNASGYNTIDTVIRQVLVQTCLAPASTTTTSSTTFPSSTTLPSLSPTTFLTLLPSSTGAATTPSPKPCESIKIANVDPLRGPIAGGTSVTVSGAWPSDQLNVTGVYIGKKLTGKITSIKSFKDPELVMFTFDTPETDEVEDDLPVMVEFRGSCQQMQDVASFNFTATKNFSYSYNPIISGVYPNEHLIRGGTKLTAVGSNLTSVAYPKILITVLVCRNSQDNCTETTETRPCVSYANQSYNYTSSMECIMPPVDIPQDFIPSLKNISERVRDRSKRDVAPLLVLSRHKRSAGIDCVQKLTGQNQLDKLYICLAIHTDGYKGNDAIFNGKEFYFFENPEINCSREVIYFNPEIQGYIEIEGKHMQSGVRENDYAVRLGAGTCEVYNLTDNQLKCSPPKTLPNNTHDLDSSYCNSRFTVVVLVGNQVYYYRCLEYPNMASEDCPTDCWNNASCSYKWNGIVMIVGLVIGLGLLIIVFILSIYVSVLCSKNRKLRRQLSDKQKTDSNTHLALGAATFGSWGGRTGTGLGRSAYGWRDGSISSSGSKERIGYVKDEMITDTSFLQPRTAAEKMSYERRRRIWRGPHGDEPYSQEIFNNAREYL